MRFLCDFLCGEVPYIDENLDEDGCLKCPTCEGTRFIVKDIKNESFEQWMENERRNKNEL